MKTLKCLFTVAAVATTVGMSAGVALAAEVDGPELEWRVSVWGTERAQTAGLERLKDILAENTDGNWKLNIGYAESFSKSRENLDGLQIGAFEMAMFCYDYHPEKTPAWGVLSLPFLPLSDPDVNLAVHKELYKNPALIKDLERWNAMPYYSTLLPQFEILGRGDAPEGLSDWEGMRVRGGGGVGAAMKELGAVPTSMTASELYSALERGTIDAAAMAFTYAHQAYKLPEVSDWFTSNMAPGTYECPIVMNKPAFEALPSQYQELLQGATDELYEVTVDAYHAMDEVNLPQFRSDMEEVVLNDEALSEVRAKAGKPVWDAWVEANKGRFDGQALIDEVFRIAEEVQANKSN